MSFTLLAIDEFTIWFSDIFSGFMMSLFLIALLYIFSIVLNLIYAVVRKEKVVWDRNHIFKKRRGVLIALLVYMLFGLASSIYTYYMLPELYVPSEILVYSIAVILLFVFQFKTLKSAK